MSGIDYDRGCIIKIEPETGMDVVMYRREPGIYYTGTGRPLPESIAERAGFDVKLYARARAKAERLAEFAAKLENEETAEEQALAAAPKDVVYEADGFKVVALGGGRHSVEDQDGNVLTGKGKFVTREIAVKLVDEMAASERAKAAKAKSKSAPVA